MSRPEYATSKIFRNNALFHSVEKEKKKKKKNDSKKKAASKIIVEDGLYQESAASFIGPYNGVISSIKRDR